MSSNVSVNAPGSGSPTGSISFSDGQGQLCSASVNSTTGIASCSYTPSAPTAVAGDSITAAYGGDTNDATSTSSAVDEVVDKASTSTALTITPPTPLVGQTVTLSATVTPAAPGAGTPTGTVTFAGNGGTLCSGSLSGSPATASCTTTYNGVTNDNITASYAGDGNFVGSSAGSTLSVDQALTTTAVAPNDPTPVVGEQVTYTATVSVTPPGSGTPTGSVTFTDGGETTLCASVPVSTSGTATCLQTYSSTGTDHVGPPTPETPTLPPRPPRPPSLSVRTRTTTTVTASPTPAVVGQAVTLTATVAVVSPGGAVPSGAVALVDGGGTCHGTLSGASPYVASCTTTYSSPVSNDAVTGTYGGDANDAGSSSTTSETVDQDATTTAAHLEPARARRRPAGDVHRHRQCDVTRAGDSDGQRGLRR